MIVTMRISSTTYAIALTTVILLLTSCSESTSTPIGQQNQSQPINSAIASSQPNKTQALYVQSTTSCCSFHSSYSPIPGMSLVLPAAPRGLHHALITFNAPTVTPSINGVCELAVFNGSSVVATMYSGGPGLTNGISGYITANIVVQVPLTSTTQTITVQYANYCTLTQFYSLSALLTV